VTALNCTGHVDEIQPGKRRFNSHCSNKTLTTKDVTKTTGSSGSGISKTRNHSPTATKNLIPQKHLIALAPRDLGVRVPNVLQEGLKLPVLVLGTLDASEDLGDVAAVVAVVEEADVEARLQRVQEAGEGAAALGELEHEEVLVGCVAAPADEVADVRFGASRL
jgi:hypothetical protein